MITITKKKIDCKGITAYYLYDNGKKVSMIKCAESLFGHGLYGVQTYKKYQNQGYMSKLMEYVINDLKSIEPKEDIELKVLCDNTIAINLYKKFGFEIIRKTKFLYLNFKAYKSAHPSLKNVREYYYGITDDVFWMILRINNN